ncbi:MAG: LTA synthase family protein, partial [Lachnospiraceae bacterium]|nr:LTA synthase family protein [Lachnospiraceae bacterium]
MKKNLNLLTDFLNRHLILSHIVLSLWICFMLEWLSRHSFISAYYFVTEHTGPYLFNSYVIFVVFSLVILAARRTTLRMILLAVFAIFGIANCVILFNRVSPFGFTDLNMITDLLTMRNTGYFNARQGAFCTVLFLIYVGLMVLLFRHDKKQTSRFSFPIRLGVVIALFLSVPAVTQALIRADIMTGYFGNLAQGYLDYGYVYGFATSMLGRGMKRPVDYNEKKIRDIITRTDMGPSHITGEDGPNIIIV